MNGIQRISKNISILFFYQIINYISGFFYVTYTARYLGVESFGLLSVALAFTGMFGVFTDLGLNQLIVRDIARNKSLTKKYIGNFIILKIMFATISVVLIMFISYISSYPFETSKIVFLMAISLFFSSFSSLIYSIFQAYERIEYQSLGQIISSCTMLIGALILVQFKISIFGFAFLYPIVGLLTAICNLLLYKYKFMDIIYIELDRKFIRTKFKEALPFGLTSLFVTIYYWIGSIMLSTMAGNKEVGIYNAAYRLIVFLLVIPIILNTAIVPVMARFFITSQDDLRFAYEKYFKYMSILALPMGVGISLLASRIIILIFGDEYVDSSVVLQILVWSSVFIFISGAFARLLESSNRQGIIAKITGVCAIENVLLNLIVIPKYSYIGASITTVLTEFSALILAVIITSKLGYSLNKNNFLDLSKSIIASLIMGLVIIGFWHLNLIILILVSSIVYFSVLIMFKIFDESDIRLIYLLLHKNPKILC